jgi:hypothetical protein
MTREEAKKILKAISVYECYPKSASEETKEAIDMAIDALERGIPKNPIINFVEDSDGARRLNDGWTEDSYLCPVCHTYFGEVFDEGYCRKCGQKLIQTRVRVIKE